MSVLDRFIKHSWWSKQAEEPHRLAYERAADLESKLSGRREKNRLNLQRYLNKRFVNLRPGEGGMLFETSDKISLNAMHAAASAVASKICMNIPRPFFLTDNGTFELQEKARLLQKWSQGILSQNDFATQHAARAFVDCEIFDFGCIKVFFNDGQVKIQRINPDAILFDPEATTAAPPRELMQVAYLKKELLMAMFPSFKGDIARADTIIDQTGATVTDLVRVVEAWHLPSSRKSTDGRHLICIEGVSLLVEEWKHQRFPFAFIRWEDRADSYIVGQSLVDQIGPIQEEIDIVINRVREANNLGSMAWIIVDKSSGINKKHLKNISHIILEKTGGPEPKVVVNPSVHPQVFQYIEMLYGKAFEVAGVSLMSATGVIPERLRGTGAAIRAASDSEDKRYALVSRQWEQMFCDVVRLAVMCAADAAADGEEIEANYKDREWIQRINFKDCQIAEDNFTIDVYPTNLLPQEVSGKLALVEQLSALGAIQDTGMILDLIQMPDVEKYASLECANVRSAHQISEFLLQDRKNWIPPEKFMDLQLCVTVAQKYWVRGHVNKIPDDRLDNLARWINEATKKMKEGEPQPQPMAPPAAQQPPMGPPMGMEPPPAMGGEMPPEAMGADIDPAMLQ